VGELAVKRINLVFLAHHLHPKFAGHFHPSSWMVVSSGDLIWTAPSMSMKDGLVRVRRPNHHWETLGTAIRSPPLVIINQGNCQRWVGTELGFPISDLENGLSAAFGWAAQRGVI